MQEGAQAPEGATTADRRDRIIKDMYLDEQQHYSVDEIGTKVGLTGESVRNRVTAMGLSRPRRSMPSNGKCVSPMHATIGQKLSQYRCFGPTPLDLKAMAQKLNISVKRLVQIERGSTELSLTEISKIATLLGMPVDKLLTPGVHAQ